MSVGVSCVYVYMYQANELHLSILWNAVHTRKKNLVYSKVYSLHNLPHYYLHKHSEWLTLFNGLQLEDIYQQSSHYPVTSVKPLFQASYNFFCSSLQRSLTWLCIYAFHGDNFPIYSQTTLPLFSNTNNDYSNNNNTFILETVAKYYFPRLAQNNKLHLQPFYY